MPFLISGKQLPAKYSNLNENVIESPEFKALPAPATTDIDTDHYDENKAVFCLEMQGAYVDLAACGTSQPIRYLQTHNVSQCTSVYLYNDQGERLLLVNTGKISNWIAVLSSFKKSSRICVIPFGGSIGPDNNENLQAYVSVSALMTSMYDQLKDNDRFTVDVVAKQVLKENTITASNVATHATSLMFNKLNVLSHFYCGTRIQKTVSFENPASNFVAISAEDKPFLANAISIATTQLTHQKIPFKWLPSLGVANYAEYMQRVSRIIFTKEALQLLQQRLVGLPLMSGFAINCVNPVPSVIPVINYYNQKITDLPKCYASGLERLSTGSRKVTLFSPATPATRASYEYASDFLKRLQKNCIYLDRLMELQVYNTTLEMGSHPAVSICRDPQTGEISLQRLLSLGLPQAELESMISQFERVMNDRDLAVAVLNDILGKAAIKKVDEKLLAQLTQHLIGIFIDMKNHPHEYRCPLPEVDPSQTKKILMSNILIANEMVSANRRRFLTEKTMRELDASEIQMTPEQFRFYHSIVREVIETVLRTIHPDLILVDTEDHPNRPPNYLVDNVVAFAGHLATPCEAASSIFFYLEDKNIDVPFEVFQASAQTGNDNYFVVLDRDPTTPRNDPKSWNSEAIVCDASSLTYFPLTKFINKYAAFLASGTHFERTLGQYTRPHDYQKRKGARHQTNINLVKSAAQPLYESLNSKYPNYVSVVRKIREWFYKDCQNIDELKKEVEAMSLSVSVTPPAQDASPQILLNKITAEITKNSWKISTVKNLARLDCDSQEQAYAIVDYLKTLQGFPHAKVMKYPNTNKYAVDVVQIPSIDKLTHVPPMKKNEAAPQITTHP